MKPIIIEIVDPPRLIHVRMPATQRSLVVLRPNSSTCSQIFDRLLQTCWVTSEEHGRLNRAGSSLQRDAPDGDEWARYRLAGVVAYPLDATETVNARGA